MIYPVRALIYTVIYVLPLTILLSTLLPLNLVLEFFTLLFALWSLAYGIQSSCEQLGVTRFVTIFMIPWLTTLPETVSTVMLALRGFSLAGALTFAGSAFFDLFLAFTILGYRHEVTRAMILVKIASLPLILALLFNYRNGVFTVSGMWLGLLLIALCVVFTLIPALGEKFFAPRLTRAQLLATIITLISSIIAFTYMCISYAQIVESFCHLIPESWAGVLNAYMTSLPDAIYAGAVREAGRVDEAIGELWSCVIHDYTETPGFALLFGSSIILDVMDYVVVATVPIIFTIVMYVFRFRVSNACALTLILLFIIYTVICITVL